MARWRGARRVPTKVGIALRRTGAGSALRNSVRIADGVVLCVHGGQTPRELVQRSAERLRLSNIPVLGALLNNLDLQQYGYTYRKSYYDYYESGDSDDRARKTV